MIEIKREPIQVSEREAEFGRLIKTNAQQVLTAFLIPQHELDSLYVKWERNTNPQPKRTR